MFFGHNLHYVAPFDFSRAGFCMEFRSASFVLPCPRVNLAARIGFWDPQVNILACGCFWAILGSRKTYFCAEIILWWGCRGIPSAQMHSMVPGTHLGVVIPPKPCFLSNVQGFPVFLEKSRWPMDHLCIFPIPP